MPKKTTNSTPKKLFNPKRVLLRSLVLAGIFAIPAVITRLYGGGLPPAVELLIFGAAVVAASFVLSWGAESAQKDISGGFAIAILAIIAVLPEYAVDLYYAFTAGSKPEFIQYAAANMTGANRLLLGLSWPLVVLVALYVAKKRSAKKQTHLKLSPENRMELGFLLVASLIAMIIPVTGEISLLLGFVMIVWFGYYMYRLTKGEQEEPDLIGTAAAIGDMPKRQRRITFITMFVVAAGVILLSAEPFAESLVATGTQFGIDQFLLVQWLAPLSSEAPEFIIAILFTLKGKGGAAIATLISSKVNQWTLLIGSLPIAYLLGGGGTALVLDPRQVEEVVLTIAQTLMGISILLSLKFYRWAAVALLLLFAVQFVVTDTHGRLILSAIYIIISVIVFVYYRAYIIATLKAPFSRIETKS